MHKFLTYLFAVLCGASLTLSYAPFDYWWIAFLAVSGWLTLIFKAESRSPMWLTWWFAFGWFGAGISWVHVSIADFGGLPILASVAMMALLCGYLALYPVLAMKLALVLGKKHLLAIYLPLTWLVCEWLRSWMLTGFPWLSLGYSQLNSPLAGWLPVIGETGVSALIVLVSTGLVIGVLQRSLWKPLLVIVVPAISGTVLNQIE